MTLLEQFAAMESRAMREVMRDNRGVVGMIVSQVTKGVSVENGGRIERRAKRTCAGCGNILPLSGRYNWGRQTMCSQQCLDDVRRWNRWIRQTKL